MKGFLQKGLIALYMLAASFLILMVCSRSSFLYPFNNWDDDNCFFTVGKAMFNGLVLYRDIYEQKGPLLYLIYGIAYSFSHTTFIGAFFIEVAFACAYMCALYKICRLYVGKIPSLAIAALTVAISFSSFTFYYGGSAEELCLPMFAFPMYFLLKCFKRGEGKMEWYKLLISGFLAGCVFLIKFTLLSFALMFVLFVIIEFIRRKNYSGLWKAALLYIGGAVIAFIPWIIYFGVNGALKDFFKVYIYNNIFLYSSKEDIGFLTSIKNRLGWYGRDFVRVCDANPVCSAFVAVGLVWIIGLNKRGRFTMDKVYVPLGAVAAFVFSFLGGYGYYYALPLTLFTVFGLIALYSGVALCAKRCKEKIAREKVEERNASPYYYTKIDCYKYGACAYDGAKKLGCKAAMAVCAAALLLSTGLCFLLSQNVSFIGYPKDGLFMYRFAAVIEERGLENYTILNYGTLDLGLYTVTDSVPTCKYFCKVNMDLQEMIDAQNEYVKEGAVDYIICQESYPDGWEEHYTLIAEDQKRFDDSEVSVYLFEKTH